MIIVKQFLLRLAVDEEADEHVVIEVTRNALELLTIVRGGPIVQIMGMEIDDPNRRRGVLAPGVEPRPGDGGGDLVAPAVAA